MRHALAVAIGFGMLAGVTTSVASAQLVMRTWVSGVGDDANPCSRTAPCRSFAGAFSKTATGGEIDALDPSAFGALNITRAITIDGGGSLAGIQATAFFFGISVDVPSDAIVILRNLSINGSATGFFYGSGYYGVRFVNGKQLIIENSRIFGFRNSGVEVAVMTGGGAGRLVISNSTISANIGNGGGGWGTGIRTSYGWTTVSHSVLTGNDGIALFAENSGIINADSNLITDNGFAASAGNGGAGQAGAIVRLSNNIIYGNLNSFACGLGLLASDFNNLTGSNAGGTGATCAPTTTITKQ
jgi:hypothetical protein